MLDQVVRRQELRDDRETRIRYGLIALLFLGVAGFLGWTVLEDLGRWRLPILAVGFGAGAFLVFWWYRAKDSVLRKVVSELALWSALIYVWSPEIGRGVNLIGLGPSLALVALALALWLLLWAGSRSGKALFLLPGTFILVVTGYISIGRLLGQTILAELMPPVIAWLIFIPTLVGYGYFLYVAWTKANPQES